MKAQAPAAKRERPGYSLSAWLFLRGLGLVYLVAFVSLWVQIEGLVGSKGILPAALFLQAVREQTGAERFWLLPTLCWISAGDGFLHFLCAGGVLLSGLVLVGAWPVPGLIVLWVFYLSLSTICRTFLSYQWDNLLLETGFLAIFLAPLQMRPRPRRPSPPPPITLWLLRWLLFRLIFSSGVVKLASGDPSWRGLTALHFHYFTQPLPTWLGWYAHQLPGWLQSASVLGMFFLELVIPFLFFAPRPLRLFAFGSSIALQLLIALTGNYAFFNLLTIALCLLLLDDRSWPRRWQERMLPSPEANQDTGHRGWPRPILVPVGLLLLSMTSVQMSLTIGLRVHWPDPVRQMFGFLAPFRSANGYGLFAVMTTSRPEIILEGSNDGETWLPYEFKWKPGDLKRRPGYVAPHQPRLDWQMWFAALGNYQHNPWFMAFLGRLLEGSPSTLALLEHNPFPERPPRYIRALLYDYRFTDLPTRHREGSWWSRNPQGLYCPIVFRPDPQLPAGLQPGARGSFGR